jgi:hypothetical protein
VTSANDFAIYAFQGPIIALMLLVGSRAAQSQNARTARVIAVIDSIYGDSAGRAIRRGRPSNPAALDSLLASLENTLGAAVWFSRSDGPKQARTKAQDRRLAQRSASGVRAELRTDSTTHSRALHGRALGTLPRCRRA